MSVRDKIENIINDEINVGLATHNGFITFDEFEEKGDTVKVYISFYGGCSGCPGALTSTLAWIENYLSHKLDNSNIQVINTETT